MCVVNVASYDNYMLINSYLTFCFLLFSMTTLLQLGVHGRYPKRKREADVDDYKTNQWLRSTGLKADTEGLVIIAAQDQRLPTKSYFARIVKDAPVHCTGYATSTKKQ